MIETVLSSSVFGPARPSGRIPGDVEQLTGRGDRHFARNGTAFAAEPDTASKVVDPLELSLAQPCAWTPRDAPRLQPVAVDTIALAALERVVERLSFGGDRRSGTARIELGGVWAGTVLLVRVSGRELSLELAGRSDTRDLGERLAARLRSRGFAAEVSLS